MTEAISTKFISRVNKGIFANQKPMNRLSRRGVIPGFNITLGYTLFYLGLIVLIPLAALFFKSAQLTWPEFKSAAFSARVLAAYRITFTTSFFAALVNLPFGLITAWVLIRYPFPGKKIVDALVDLPFALPTAVAGIALTTLYSQKGFLGKILETELGIKVAYTPLGIWVALTFIGLPFVVRTVQPVLEDLDKEVEEAAASLGATRLQTFFRIILSLLWGPLLTGFGLAFARGLGEYGSVVFISGNMPMKTEIVPLAIITKLEQYDYKGATAVAVVMLLLSFTLLLAINLLQRWLIRRHIAS
jgi:sulfate/thiosulfate transport system permease protein